MYRPDTLKNVIGQNKVRQQLSVILNAARQENRAMPHILFSGPPGLGKTTLARAVANDYGSNVVLANGATIRRQIDIIKYVVKLRKYDILFIDEIHALPTKLQESLYTIMEDFRIDMGDCGYSKSLSPFTLIGATTESGLLSGPLYDRFIYKMQLDGYSYVDIGNILKRASNAIYSDNDYILIAKRSRFVPRIGLSLLQWVKDYLLMNPKKTVEDALNSSDFDKNGLTKDDIRYILTLKRMGGKAGLQTICSAAALSKDTVENVVEPYLLRRGIIAKTKVGRMLCSPS